jgi:hypothetical protein
MLTGIVPFGKPTPHAVMMAHVTEEPPSMTSLGQQTPLEVEAVVIKAMAKAPEDRYQWAGDLARDLGNAITCTGLSVTDPLDELVAAPESAAERGRTTALPATSTPPVAAALRDAAGSAPPSADTPSASPATPPVETAQKRSRPKWLWPVVGLLAAGVIAVTVVTCIVGIPLLSRLAQAGATPTWAPPQAVASHTPLPSAPPQAGEPIYQEDFTAPGSEWEISSGENAEYRVVGGVYSIQVHTQNWIAWNKLGLDLYNFEIEFEVTLVEGDSFNDAGLLYRFQDLDNYYEVDLNGEGSFRVGKQIDGEWTQILDWTDSPAIQPFGSVNRVRLVAEGDQFELIVNDLTVAQFTDDTYAGGSVAPVVTAYDEPPARATFDNIRIWELP